MRALIKGAGDIASGIAVRLYRSGFEVAMTELPIPSSIRRTVCFSEAVRLGETSVEGITARRAGSAEEAETLMAEGVIPVLADERAECLALLQPDVLVDAILAKYNTGTKMTDAPHVIGVGPGFSAGEDCHAVVETMRGHTLGRVIWTGSAIPNTNIPGLIGGYAGERVLRSANTGIFHALHEIGDTVEAGEAVGEIGGVPLCCTIGGVLRGLLPEGFFVPRAGFKSGDVDPRCELFHCYTVSDKALAVGGGALEAALVLTGKLGKTFHSEKRAEEYGK